MAHTKMWFWVFLGAFLGNTAGFWVQNFVKCNLCETQMVNGPIGDCCCDSQSVIEANQQHFHPLLTELVKTRFFRYFKVNLWDDCPFWETQPTCGRQDCSVWECSEDEVPLPWKVDDENCRTEQDISRVVNTGYHGDSLSKQPVQWSEQSTNLWVAQAKNKKAMVYVNLLDNPEAFTGYAGSSAQKVWSTIYNHNCFRSDPQQLCLEERVFFRLLSGMHASINTHLSRYYSRNGEDWKPNLGAFTERVGRHPSRIENMHFTFLFLLRALNRLLPYLKNQTWDTGDIAQDNYTKTLIDAILDTNTVEPCSVVFSAFNESALFRNDVCEQNGLIENNPKMQLKEQLRKHFYNISLVMDCVECEKCRVWGKLQTTGLGTAIKIVLAEDVQELYSSLERNELIAFFNFLTRISSSIANVEYFRELELQEKTKNFYLTILAILLCCVVLFFSLSRKLRSKVKKQD